MSHRLPRTGLALALLLALPALATTLLRLDLGALARDADTVVRGRVLRVESRWAGDGMRIVTDVEVEVAEALKGSPGARVTLTQPGGVVGDIGQVVQGMAAFDPGEEVVLFLEQRGGGKGAAARFRLRGMAQGKYRVERGSDGAAWAVPEALGDTVLLDPQTRAPAPSALERLPLEALRREVVRAAGAPRPGDAR